MRPPRVPLTILIAAIALAPAAVATGVLAQELAQQAQPKAQAQPPAKGSAQQAPAPMAPLPPGPYKPVAITLPAPLNDPTFDEFRKKLADIAQKKNRSALT